MLENLNFKHESGTKKPAKITVYALSTCGFCKRALEFLRENKIEFRYIYVDQQSPQIKVQIKQDLRDNFEERLGFPFVVFDDGKKVKAMVGFREDNWKEAFLS